MECLSWNSFLTLCLWLHMHSWYIINRHFASFWRGEICRVVFWVLGFFLICYTGSGSLALNIYQNDRATCVRKKIFYRIRSKTIRLALYSGLYLILRLSRLLYPLNYGPWLSTDLFWFHFSGNKFSTNSMCVLGVVCKEERSV